MQIVSERDNLHEMSNLFSGNNKKYFVNLLSVKIARRVLQVSYQACFEWDLFLD